MKSGTKRQPWTAGPSDAFFDLKLGVQCLFGHCPSFPIIFHSFPLQITKIIWATGRPVPTTRRSVVRDTKLSPATPNSIIFMKNAFLGLFFIILFAHCNTAKNLYSEQDILQLSKGKWQWMADKNVEKLAPLFHEDSRFVHMSGTWGKAKELEIIINKLDENIKNLKRSEIKKSKDIIDNSILYIGIP